MGVPGERRETDGDPSDTPPPSSLMPHAYTLTGLLPSSLPPPPEETLLRTLADVLLAAAHADGELCERERRTLNRLLVDLTGTETMPEWLAEHIKAFDPARFDLEASARELRRLPPMQRRHVAELVRAVCDA